MLPILLITGGLLYLIGHRYQHRWVFLAGAGALIIALIVLLSRGQMDVMTVLISFIAFPVTVWLRYGAVQPPALRTLLWSALILWILALGFRLLPGFSSVVLMIDGDDYVFRSEKLMLLGLLVLLALPEPHDISVRSAGQSLMVVLAALGVLLAVIVPAGWLGGFLTPGLADTPLFVMGVAFFLHGLYTVAVEELFFRSVIQNGLIAFASTFWTGTVASYMGVVGAAVCFGVAHSAGGPTLVVLATVAGLGYGVVYRMTRRLAAAIGLHLLINGVWQLGFAG